MQRIKPLHGKKSLLPGDRIRFSNVCAHNLPYLKEVSPSRWLTVKSVNVGRGKFFPHPPMMLFRVVEVNQSFYEDMITDWQFKQDLPVYKKPLTKDLPNI